MLPLQFELMLTCMAGFLVYKAAEVIAGPATMCGSKVVEC